VATGSSWRYYSGNNRWRRKFGCKINLWWYLLRVNQLLTPWEDNRYNAKPKPEARVFDDGHKSCDPNMNERQTILAPLNWLAPFARKAMVFGAFAVLLALALLLYAVAVWPMILGAFGGSILLLASASAWYSKRQMFDLLRDSKAISDLLDADPDPVVVTSATGEPLVANAAAGSLTEPTAHLKDWCVDPDRVVAGMLANVLRLGQFQREFVRKNKTLRVVAHRSGGAGLSIVWRFVEQNNRAIRGLDAVGLPILTVGDGAVFANAAARALADDDACAAIAKDAVHSLASAGGGALVTLPSGLPMQAIGAGSSDGYQDVVLVSPEAFGHDVKPAHVADFEEIPVALLQLDAEGRISGTNRLARSLLALGVNDERFFWQVVEGLGRPVADWLTDAQAGRALGRPEILRASLTGSETYVQIILRRVGDMGGQGGLVAVISDATELKSLEARFVQSQKMQAIGQLAGGIAHDFNNLLTAISGHCDLLLINRDRYDPDYDDLLQIHQNSNRAAALVRQLLAFSRKQTMKPEILSLESLLEELTHLLTRLVGERINLNLVHDPALTVIRADRRQLEQVIMNLVVNARDAMPMGGTIRVETESQQFDSELEIGRARIPPGDYAVIRVTDEGVGIPAAIIDKIFEPFFTTKRLGEGTGLGLSTAYGIVKQLGGYIFAQSVEGSGTVFTLYFASLSGEAAAKEAEHVDAKRNNAQALDHHDAQTKPQVSRSDKNSTDSEVSELIEPEKQLNTQDKPRAPNKRIAQVLPAEPMRGGTILLVEDEAPVRAFAARALRLRGYSVFEAQDGEQALEFLEDRALRIDLFVTDVIMPGIDGPGWVSQALKDRPGTPVVFVSGYTEDTLSEALSRIPRAIFLGKPFSLHDLSEAIDTQLAE